MARRWIVVVLAGSLLAACGQDRDPAGAPPTSAVPSPPTSPVPSPPTSPECTTRSSPEGVDERVQQPVSPDVRLCPSDTGSPARERPQPVESGGYIEPGYSMPFRMYVYCGIAVLGQLNHVWWMTGSGGVPVPRAWSELVDPEAHTLVVDVVVRPGPDPTVRATANGRSVMYSPVTADDVPACD